MNKMLVTLSISSEDIEFFSIEISKEQFNFLEKIIEESNANLSYHSIKIINKEEK